MVAYGIWTMDMPNLIVKMNIWNCNWELEIPIILTAPSIIVCINIISSTLPSPFVEYVSCSTYMVLSRGWILHYVNIQRHKSNFIMFWRQIELHKWFMSLYVGIRKQTSCVWLKCAFMSQMVWVAKWLPHPTSYGKVRFTAPHATPTLTMMACGKHTNKKI